MTSKGTGKMTPTIIGADIAKDTLEAHHLDRNESRRLANTASGHKALIGWIGTADARLVFEPAGPYHRAFERAMARAGLGLCKVNPRRARRFAEAMGVLAKTDRIDAALLARMGSMLALEPGVAHPVLLSDLKQLLVARNALVKDRTAAKNHAKQEPRKDGDPWRSQTSARAAIASDCTPDAGHRGRNRRPDRIRSGTCPQVRHPHIHCRRLASDRLRPDHRYARTGYPRRQKGRQPRRPGADDPPVRTLERQGLHHRRTRHLRQVLYMPALVATRFNPDLKQNTMRFAKQENPQRSPSPPSCESSSCSQTP